MNEFFFSFIRISLIIDPNGPIDNNPALVQIMAWQAIIWTNVDTIYWRIYAVLGEDVYLQKRSWVKEYYKDKMTGYQKLIFILGIPVPKKMTFRLK